MALSLLFEPTLAQLILENYYFTGVKFLFRTRRKEL